MGLADAALLVVALVAASTVVFEALPFSDAVIARNVGEAWRARAYAVSYVVAFGIGPAAVPLIGAFLNGPAHIGLLPILYGITMWLQQAMNPAVPDPMQRRIFALMPVVLAFVLAPSPAGVLIYWVWSTILSILQQYIIMHRFGAENPIDSFIARVKSPKTKAA